jgi:hypothetical protein
MKLDKAERPKIIALGVLLAVFLGYGAYTLVGKKASAAPPTSVREAAIKNAPAGVPASAKKVVVIAGTQQTQVSLVPLEVSAPKKDPFTPCVSMESQTSSGRRPVMPRLKNMASLPPFRLPQSPLSIGVRPTGDLSLPTAAEQDPQFVLTGVIQGATNVAIIRAGDSARHIVKVGQLIDGKYFVKFIGRDRVVLTHGVRSIDLRLGGGTNAS